MSRSKSHSLVILQMGAPRLWIKCSVAVMQANNVNSLALIAAQQPQIENPQSALGTFQTILAKVFR